MHIYKYLYFFLSPKSPATWRQLVLSDIIYHYTRQLAVVVRRGVVSSYSQSFSMLLIRPVVRAVLVAAAAAIAAGNSQACGRCAGAGCTPWWRQIRGIILISLRAVYGL